MTAVVPKNPALSVRFFLTKQTLSNPSHSSQLISGLGLLGTSLTTLLSTAGGGRKLFRAWRCQRRPSCATEFLELLPTIFMICVTVAHICVLTERRE